MIRSFTMRDRLAAGVVLGCLTGCLPISHTVVTSPPVVGELRLRSGAPAVGHHVAIVSGSTKETCSSAALRTVTDSTGFFTIPVGTKRERWLILLPFERFGTSYTICVGSGPNDLASIFSGVGTLHADGPASRVDCVTPSVPGHPATCVDRPGPER